MREKWGKEGGREGERRQRGKRWIEVGKKKEREEEEGEEGGEEEARNLEKERV